MSVNISRTSSNQYGEERYEVIRPLNLKLNALLVKDTDKNSIFACKILKLLNETQINEAVKEYKVMQECKNFNNVVKYLAYTFFFSSIENLFLLFIIQEKMENNIDEYFFRLNKFNEKLSFERVIKMILEILNGLNDLFKHHKFHGNIKPENILISESNIFKLSDPHILKYSRTGIPTKYLSNILLESKTLVGRSVKSDIYLIGVILLEKLGYNEKFKNFDIKNKKIVLRYKKEIKNTYGEGFLSIIENMLEKNPLKRANPIYYIQNIQTLTKTGVFFFLYFLLLS